MGFPGKRFLVVSLCLCLGIGSVGGALAAAAEPVNFKQLLPLVTVKLPGWEMEGDPRGSTMKNPGFTFSEVEASYKQGDKTLVIRIMDNPQAAMAFMAMGYAQGMVMESTEETIKGVKISDCPGIETFRPKEKEAKIDLITANRFMVTMEGQGFDNAEELKNLLQHVDLAKLAELAK